MVQRVEQHTTQRQVQPTVQTQVQNVEKLEIKPFVMREEQHTKQTTVVPEVKQETQNINKKVIQPIIKDVIQPVHIKVKPIVQEGIKPVIFKGQAIGQAINQGTQNLPASYLGTNMVQEISSGTTVRESIFKTTTLPVQYKPVEVKPEIGGAGLEVNSAQGFSLGQINGGTTVRPSIIRNSVLPTINQGTTVLNTVYGGTRTTIAPPGETFGLAGQGVTTTVVKPIVTTVGSTIGSTVGYGATSTQYAIGAGTGYNGKIMGVNTDIGDLAADVTYSTKPDANTAVSISSGNTINLGNTVANTINFGNTVGGTIGLGNTVALGTMTGSNVGYGTTASQYGTVTNAGFSGKIMGVSEGVADLAADVTYSTKPNNNPIVQPGLI
jgi:hypothetical protein